MRVSKTRVISDSFLGVSRDQTSADVRSQIGRPHTSDLARSDVPHVQFRQIGRLRRPIPNLTSHTSDCYCLPRPARRMLGVVLLLGAMELVSTTAMQNNSIIARFRIGRLRRPISPKKGEKLVNTFNNLWGLWPTTAPPSTNHPLPATKAMTTANPRRSFRRQPRIFEKCIFFEKECLFKG